MGKMMTTALAGAFLGLTAGSVSAADPFSNFNLSGSYVIQAHGFHVNQFNPNRPSADLTFGENAILGIVTFDGNRGVVPGGGFSVSHADNFETIDLSTNCSLAITGGSYAVNAIGAGTVTLNLISDGGFPGGSPACGFVGSSTGAAGASFTFAFVLNNSGVLGSLGTPNPTSASSASLQLIGFQPPDLSIVGPSGIGFGPLEMNLQGTLRLQGGASE
jgi:hypothetical protein